MQPVPVPLRELQDRDATDPSATDRSINRLPSSSSTVAKAAGDPSSDEDDREQDTLQRRATDLLLVQTSFDDIQGQFAKLTAMASQLSDSIGKLVASRHTSKVAASTPAPARVVSQVFDESPTPQLFGEMSRPRYCPRKFSSPLHYYREQETSIQNSCVQSGSTNLSEQNIDDMPQASGFHILNCKSVVLEPMFAVYEDETDSSSSEFFDVSATATDRLQSQPFEQLPVFDIYDDDTEGFSNVSVDVCAIIPEQQPYEDTQQGSRQSPKCFSMPICSPETPTVGIDIDHRLNCPCEASECRTWDEEYQGDDNSLWEKSVCQTATRHYISLFPWDPGASTPLHSSKPKPREELSYVAIVISKVGTYGKQLRDPIWNVLVLPEKRKEWDPGDTTFHVLFTTADDATKLMCTNVYRSARLQILAVKFGARRALVFESAVMGYLASDLRWTEVNAIILFVLAVTCSTGEAKLQWDPGIVSSSSRFIWLVSDKHRGQTRKALVWLQSQLFSVLQLQMSKTSPVWDQSILSLMHMMWGKTAVQTRVHISHTSFQLFDFIEQLVNLKHSRSELLLQCNSWCYIPNAFLQVAQEEREEAAHITQANYICSLYCNSVLKMSCVWDPGVNKSLYDWLTILTGWSATDKQFSCTHITAAAIEPNQLVGNTLLLQFLFTRRKDMVTKGTTTSPNGSQQNCNTNNLLPSQNYLQFVELGIMFITFLPP